MRPQHILSPGGGFVALVVFFTACHISPTDARPEEWNGRPAEPFLLVAEAAESSIDITLAAIEVATERRRHSWTIARSTSTSVRISPSGGMAVARQGLTDLRFFDLQTGSTRKSQPAPGAIRDVAFVSDGVVATMVQIATSGIPGRQPWGGMVLFDARTGTVLDSVRTPAGQEAASTVVGGIATSPRFPGRVWSSQPLQQTITVFDANARTVLTQFDVDFQPHALALSADGSELWVQSAGTLAVLDPQSGVLQRSLSLPDPQVAFTFAVSGDGAVVFLGYENGFLRMVDARSGTSRSTVRLDGTIAQLVTLPGSRELLVLLTRRGEFVGDNFFVTGPGELRRVDGSTLAELQRIETGAPPLVFAVVVSGNQ